MTAYPNGGLSTVGSCEPSTGGLLTKSLRTFGVWDSRFQEKREQLHRFYGPLLESNSQNLALTVLHVPNFLDSGANCGEGWSLSFPNTYT